MTGSKKGWIAAAVSALLVVLVACGPLVLPASVALVTASVLDPAGGGDAGEYPDDLNEDAVPAEYLTLIQAAGMKCSKISAPLLAAQIEVESGWNPDARSPAGAMGIAQFTEATWNEWGSDYDLDLIADPFNPVDAIGSMADYMCHLADLVSGWVEDGRASGDVIDLALAGYNAGPGAVSKHGGVPPYAETRSYIVKVRAALAKYSRTPPVESSGVGAAIVEAARIQLGVPYVWGGGDLWGPTGGGWDCSGLVRYAVYAGAGIDLGRPANAQARDGRGSVIARDFDQMQPGDIVAFSNSGGRHYQHIGIYIGGGEMIHAPNPSTVVKVAPLRGNPVYAPMVWTIRRYG